MSISIAAERVKQMFESIETILADLLREDEATLLDHTIMGLTVHANEAAAQARQKGLFLPRTEREHGGNGGANGSNSG